MARRDSLVQEDLQQVDAEKSSLEEVLELLHTSKKEGLTQDQAQRRLDTFGPNALREKKVNPILQFLSFMWNPMSWVMELAAIVAIAVSNGQGKPPDWEDFLGIVALLLINASIGYYEESKAGSAVDALKASLAPEATVRRDGKVTDIPASEVVPGDILIIKLGDMIPADGKLIEGDEGMKIDQAALTGESLPVSKTSGQTLFSGSVVKQGEGEMVVTSTGENTFIGRAAHLVSETEGSGHFQLILSRIGMFCIGLMSVFLVLLIIIQYAAQKYNYRVGINNVLTILIGSIPIAMPTVLSVTLAIGAEQLAKKKAIVTRITAIEELAGMSILCSDKTGTLTLNELTVQVESIQCYSDLDVNQCILMAARASRLENADAIDTSIVASACQVLASSKESVKGNIVEKHFLPFDPVGKKTQVTYVDLDTGKTHRVCKGAPQIILNLAVDKSDPLFEQVEKDIDAFAKKGYRALGVAMCEVKGKGDVFAANSPQGGPWKLICNLAIFDPPRHDTKETIARAMEMGVPVKMITGDAVAIARETASLLGMGTNIHESSALFGVKGHEISAEGGQFVQDADGFAGVFPEHKYAIVKYLRDRGYMVGMTGDGVNDAPALKVANVGVAVAGATDAARAAADIVLTEKGLSVIIDAMIGARKIFQRMVSYSIYACSTTVGIVVRFTVAVWAFKFNMPPFPILIMAYLNDGTIMTISKDRVKPSPRPSVWNLTYIFAQATAFGLYMALSTLIFIFTINRTDFWENNFSGLRRVSLLKNDLPDGSNGIDSPILNSIVYLQTSILGQALIFVTRSRSFFFMERPGLLLILAFCLAQVVATLIAVYANWSFTEMEGIGWGWALAVWVWDIIWFIPLDLIKIFVRYTFEEGWKSLYYQSSAAPVHYNAKVVPDKVPVFRNDPQGRAQMRAYNKAQQVSHEVSMKDSLKEIAKKLD